MYRVSKLYAVLIRGENVVAIKISTTIDQDIHEDCLKRGLKWSDLLLVGYQTVADQGVGVISWRGKHNIGELKRRVMFFSQKTAELQRTNRDITEQLIDLKKTVRRRE